MKKSSLLSLLIILGCNRGEVKAPLLVSEWLETTQATHRTVASSEDGKCLSSLYNVTSLKKEVEELERPYLGQQKVDGHWNHLDLSSLPVTQANFLKTYGKEIGDLNDPGSIDFSQCSDLPCIFNKIYGHDDGVAGYVHYLWYLKLGHMLSLDNNVPKQISKTAGVFNNKSFSLKDYLWDEQELYGFWRLTHIIKFPHHYIPRIREIQRIPRGEQFEETDYKTSCGLASTNGWIKFSDKCLVFNKNRDEGYFYSSVMHELTHELDYEEGRKLYQATHRSHQKDYLEVSGFYLLEYKDENDNLKKSWKTKTGSKFVTAYSGTSPQENFAEMMSYFRLDGEKIPARAASKHLDLISKEYYQGQKYNYSSLIRNWFSESEIQRAARRAYHVCKDSWLCKGKVEQVLKDKIMLEKPEGCKVLKQSSIWKNEFKSFMSKLDKTDDSNVVAGAQSYVNCYGEPDEEACYKAIVSNPSFVESKKNVIAGYRKLLTAKQETIRKSSLMVWTSCMNIDHKDDEIPTGQHFHIADGYLISSIYNCLNIQIPDGIKSAVSSLKVKNPREEVILFEEIKPLFIKLTKDIYEKERKKEAQVAAELIASDKGKMRSIFKESKTCRQEALFNIPLEPLFHLKKELFGEYIDKKVCN